MEILTVGLLALIVVLLALILELIAANTAQLPISKGILRLAVVGTLVLSILSVIAAVLFF